MGPFHIEWSSRWALLSMGDWKAETHSDWLTERHIVLFFGKEAATTIIQKATASGQITWMADGEYGGGGMVCLYLVRREIEKREETRVTAEQRYGG